MRVLACWFVALAAGLEDYYKTLGVRKTASAKAIRKRYRQLAKELHPDKNDDPNAADRFNEVATAYEVLGDTLKRREYDDERRRPPQQRFPQRQRRSSFDGGGNTVRVYRNGRVYEVPIEDFFGGFQQPRPRQSRLFYAATQLLVLALFVGAVYVITRHNNNVDEEPASPRRQREKPIVVTPESSVKELKLEAQRRGLSVAGCAEKDDLIGLLGLRHRRPGAPADPATAEPAPASSR